MKKLLLGSLLYSTTMFGGISITDPYSQEIPRYTPIKIISNDLIINDPIRSYYYCLLLNNITKKYDTIKGNTKAELSERIIKITNPEKEREKKDRVLIIYGIGLLILAGCAIYKTK